MKQVEFNYLNKKFTLDLEKGELFGDDEIIKQQIIDGVNDCKNGGYLGGHCTPFPYVNVDNLFGDIEQFSVAFYYGITQLEDLYPKELDKFLPEPPPPLDDLNGLITVYE